MSDNCAQVSWFKDEVELYCKTGLDMKRNGTQRKLIVQSAKVWDSGVYSCRLVDDVVTFHVDVEGDFFSFQTFERRFLNDSEPVPLNLYCNVHTSPSAPCQGRTIA